MNARAPTTGAGTRGAALRRGAAALGLLLLSCSWQRFDDLRQGTPVVQLERPNQVGVAFGSAVAAVSNGDSVFVVSAGTERAAAYSLGQSGDPALESVDPRHCSRQGDDTSCWPAETIAGLSLARTASGNEEPECFFTGSGQVGDQKGLVARCMSRLTFAWAVPSVVEPDLVDSVLEGNPATPLRLAADSSGQPVLMAGTPQLAQAWFYAPLSNQPRLLQLPQQAPESYGAALAAARVEGGRLLAVGAPDQGQVWLFLLEQESVQLLGCLGGSPSWGKTLAAGDVDADGQDDLLVASDDYVSVFAGGALASLPPLPEDSAVECGLTSLPAGALLSSFSCATGEEARGCAGSGFAEALDTGDFDGDGAAEIAVGAPNLVVRDKQDAGAVLIYSLEGELVDTQIHSHAGAGDAFGAALTTVPQRNRDVLVVGAPGASTTSVAYCATVSGEDTSPRCE